jgi:L-threonylcarbamoyladenylate synthase
MSTTLSIDEAVTLLRRGELVAFPTETVYGLGADALNQRALEQMYRLKGRPKQHPVIVHMADTAQVDAWVSHYSEQAQQLATAFWPGPLTMILPKSGLVPDAVCGGHPGVGLRIPRHPVAQRLLTQFDGGIAAPSANRYGQLSPTLAHHVRQGFGMDCPALLEGGPSQVGLESTIVDMLNPSEPKLLRAGHISALAISEILGLPVHLGGTTPAPGTVKHHYAPKTPLMLIDHLDIALASRQRVAVLSWLPRPQDLPDTVIFMAMPDDPERYNRRLYAALHEADALHVEAIWVLLPLAGAIAWQPALDRLQRASYAKDTITNTQITTTKQVYKA